MSFKKLEIDAKIGKGKSVIKFYADWCAPCKNVVGPLLDNISNKEEFSNISFYSVNVDDSIEVSELYDVLKVPTVIIIEDGEEVHRFIGTFKEQDIIEKLK